MNQNRMVDGPDKGWSWVVLMASFINHFILSGIMRGYGIFFVHIIETYSVTRKEASWPLTILTAVNNMFGPFTGILERRFGIKPIAMLGAFVCAAGLMSCFFANSLMIFTLFYGVVFGIGCSFVINMTILVVNVYFLKQKALANSINFSGGSMGALSLPLLMDYMIIYFGLSGCMLIASGLVLNLCITSYLFRKPTWLLKRKLFMNSCQCREDSSHIKEQPMPEELLAEKNSLTSCHQCASGHETNIDIHEKSNSLKIGFLTQQKQHLSISKSFKVVFACPMFYLTALESMVILFIFFVFNVTIVDYSADCGVPNHLNGHLIVALSAGDLIGRLCLPWMTDYKYIDRLHFLIFTTATTGFILLALPFAITYWSQIICCFSYGLMLGGTIVVMAVLTHDYIGSEAYSIAIGCSLFCIGFTTLLTPLLIGYFRDIMGSYKNMFYVLGIISLVSASAWLSEKCMSQEKNKASIRTQESIRREIQET